MSRRLAPAGWSSRPKGRPAAQRGAEALGGEEGGSVGPTDQARRVIRKSPPGQGPRGLRPGVTGWVPKEQPLAQVKLLPEEGRATQ